MAAKDPIAPVCHMKSVGAAVADGGPTFRFGHVPGPAPMMRRNSDIVGLSGLGKCCSSKQVEARRRNWASVLAAYSSSSSSHPDSPIITTLSSRYHHNSIVSQYLMGHGCHDFNSLPPGRPKVAQPSGEYTEDTAG